MYRTLIIGVFFYFFISKEISAKNSLPNQNSNPFPRMYVVKDEPTLGEISLKLYGTTKKWKKIAEWNNLQVPYPLSIGQKLKLLEPPSLTLDSGNLELLKMWRAQLNKNEINSLGKMNQTSFSGWGEISNLNENTSKVPNLFEEEKRIKLEEERIQKEKEIFLANLKNTRIENGEDSEAIQKEENFEQLLLKAQNFLKEKKYEEALIEFRRAKYLKEDSIECSMGEIRSLKFLNRLEDAIAVAKLLLKDKPELSGLPLFKSLGIAGND